jgi:hypothetical protein
MKKLFLACVAASMLMACNQADKKEAKGADSTATDKAPAYYGDEPFLKFEEEAHDFGKITEGDSVVYQFKFKNVGKSPVIITNATASCGCTVPKWPKEPILPGKSGTIDVVFNSAGKVGLQDKMITITSNMNPPQSVVRLIGEVLQKK